MNLRVIYIETVNGIRFAFMFLESDDAESSEPLPPGVEFEWRDDVVREELPA